MAFVPKGNKIQNAEETAHTITSVNDNVDRNAKDDSQPTPEPFRSFVEETSMHGARFLFSNNIFRRGFWTVLLVLSSGYCIFQIYASVQFYYQRPFNIKITKITPKRYTSLPFPAVTLCNLNLFNLRRYRRYQMGKNLTKETIEGKRDVIAKLLARSEDVFNNETKNEHQELFWRFYGEVPEVFFLNLFSHEIEQMLLPRTIFNSCLYDETACGPENFTQFISSTYGRCYTFNSGRDGHPVVNATMAGKLNGFRLLLNIERESYLENPLNPFVGLTVLIHDQNTFPFMEQFGFVVQPGVQTLCSVKRKMIQNLEHPYAAHCIKNGKLEKLESIKNSYSKPGCLMLYLGKFIIAKCGCRPVEYRALQVPLCAPNDTVLCLFPTYRKYGKSTFKDECEESCREPCQHTEYETSLSYAGLHKNVFAEKLSSHVNLTNNFPLYEQFLSFSDREKKEYIDENIISLDIFFHDMSYDKMEQTKAYEAWTLLANLGGTFGLFLGASILTVLEILEFIIRRIWSNICS